MPKRESETERIRRITNTPKYQASGAEVRNGDVVHVAPNWVHFYGRIGKIDGKIVRRSRDGTWVDVEFYTGPGSIFPEIVTTHRRIPTHRLNLVRREEED